MNIINFIPYGRSNAISRTSLAIAAGLPDRTVRELVSNARSAWTPIEPFICSESSDKGYWLTRNVKEIEAFRNWYDSYRRSSGRLMENLDRQLAKINGTNLVYVRAHYRRIGGGL